MGSNEVDADVLHLLKKFLDNIRFHNPASVRRRTKFLAPLYPKKTTWVVSKAQIAKKKTIEEPKYDGDRVVLKSKLLMNDSGDLVETNPLEEGNTNTAKPFTNPIEKTDKSDNINTYENDLENQNPKHNQETSHYNNDANPNEDSKGYPNETIQSLKDNQSDFPQIVTHHISNKNDDVNSDGHKTIETNEEQTIREKEAQDESSPDKKQPKEEDPETRLGAEMLDFIWQFILGSYYSKNITVQLIQSVS